MRLFPITAFAAAALFAAPAFAQQSSNQGGGQQSSQPPKAQAAAGQNQQSGQGSGQQSAQMQAMGQGKLRSTLEKAGFSSIEILDAAYLVNAKSPDGNQVMMFINPPAVGASADASSGGDQSGSGQTTTQKSKP
jgi:hypothetical protein